MSNMFNGRFPSGLHIYAKGQEPLPSGLAEEDRPAYEQNKKMERYMVAAMESCPAKTIMAGGAGMSRVRRFIPFIYFCRVLMTTLVRTGHRRLLLTHVCVLCVRRPVAATTNPSRQEHGAASTRRLQRDGTRNVVYWKRFWKSRRAVRGYRVRNRVGEWLFFNYVVRC